MNHVRTPSRALHGRGGQSTMIGKASQPYQIQVRSPLGAWRDQGPAIFNATQAQSRFESLPLSPGYQARLLKGSVVIRPR